MSVEKFSVSANKQQWQRLLYLCGVNRVPLPSPSSLFQRALAMRVYELEQQTPEGSRQVAPGFPLWTGEE